MNEKIRVTFQQSGRPLTVTSLELHEGITFAEPIDASPLNLGFGLQSLQPVRLASVQQRHGWSGDTFAFDARLDAGGILFSGFQGDPAGLPPGPYDVTVEVESYTLKNGQSRIVVKDGATATLVLEVKPETRRIELRNNFDAVTGAVIEASTIDGKDMASWLAGAVRPLPRVQRRVCALNILSRLAAPPMPAVKRGLTRHVRAAHFADVDRLYITADPILNDILKGFVAADGWEGEGPPRHPIHRRVVTDALRRFPELRDKTPADFVLQSYRQGGRTGLQIVVAIPKFEHPVVYADIDIDLGNPLWDVEGVLIHLGELLDGGPTDHFKVREKLAKMLSSDFIFFTVKDA